MKGNGLVRSKPSKLTKKYTPNSHNGKCQYHVLPLAYSLIKALVSAKAISLMIANSGAKYIDRASNDQSERKHRHHGLRAHQQLRAMRQRLSLGRRKVNGVGERQI